LVEWPFAGIRKAYASAFTSNPVTEVRRGPQRNSRHGFAHDSAEFQLA
jgi:hypothetical protein